MPRPEIPVDWKRVDELLESGSPGTEIASFFGMHPDTFYRRVEEKYNMGFTAYLTKMKQKGDALIREAQYKKALKKQDNTMLIWLGKQRLGQKENHSDLHIPEEIMKPFVALMAQLRENQSARRIEDNNIINEQKSE